MISILVCVPVFYHSLRVNTDDGIEYFVIFHVEYGVFVQAGQYNVSASVSFGRVGVICSLSDRIIYVINMDMRSFRIRVGNSNHWLRRTYQIRLGLVILLPALVIQQQADGVKPRLMIFIMSEQVRIKWDQHKPKLTMSYIFNVPSKEQLAA